MKSPYSGQIVNGRKIPDGWYCDICGGFFSKDDAGYLSDDCDVCEECHEMRFDTSEGETIN